MDVTVVNPNKNNGMPTQQQQDKEKSTSAPENKGAVYTIRMIAKAFTKSVA